MVLQAAAALSGALLLLSTVAVSISRLHDRGWRGSWLLLLYGMPALLIASSVIRLVPPQLAPISRFGGILAVPFVCWALIELGCVRGTIGTNRFGRDPSEGAPQRASKEGLLRLLFSFDGRLNRARFVLSALAMSTLLVGGLVASVLLRSRMAVNPSTTIQLTTVIATLICLVSLAALSIRRLQDMDLSPSLVVLLVVPWVLTAIWPALKAPSTLVDIFGVLALSCAPGTIGANRYGPDRFMRNRHKRQPVTSDAAAPGPASAPMAGAAPTEPRVKLSSLLSDVSP
jgi:uncharacterized membrane protein YhaH (DUF805 family)